MKKIGLFLLGTLLSNLLPSFTHAVFAQEIITVPFTAVEEGQEKSSCCGKRLYLGAEFIYSDVKMDRLNDYVAYLNSPTPYIDTFDDALGFYVYLDYFFNKNIGIELGYERLEADVSGGNFKADTVMDGALVSLLVRHSFGQGNFSIGAKIGVGYYNGDYEERENAWFFKNDDSEIGFRVSVFSNYCLTESLSIYISGGYRYLVFDEYDIPLATPFLGAELDFSGVFGTIGLTLDW